MNKRKPPSKAPTAVKTRSRREPIDELPEGFEDVSSSYNKLPPWDFKKHSRLVGTVQRIEEAHTKTRFGERDTQVAEVITEDGEEVALWHSAGLNGLFDVMEPGSKIHVTYLGMKALGDGRNMATYRALHRGQ